MKDPNAKEGMRVRLISMVDDPNPVPAGSEGTIRLVDDMGTIHVRWDDGRTLGLIPGVDDYTLQPSIGDFFDEIHEEASGGAAIKSTIARTSSTVNKSMPKPTKLSSTTSKSLGSMGIKTGQATKSFKSANIKDVKVEGDKDTSWDELVTDEVQDQIKGGKADKLSIKDLSKKHKVSIDDIKKEIRIGVKIEKEHVGDDVNKAKEIAMDHISEFSDYYSNKRYGVLTSEKGLKKSKKKKDNTDYMTSTGSVGGVNGMGYTSPAAWGAGVLTKKTGVAKPGPIKEMTDTTNTDRTEGTGTLAFADVDKDGWLFDDKPYWKGGKIVDPLSKVKTKWGDSVFSDVSTKEKLKKEDLIRLIKTRIIETKKGVTVDIENGDTILTGRFKNRKEKVKSIGKDDKNQPTVNKKPMLKFKVPKLNPKDGDEKELDETTTFASVWAQNGPPVGPAFAAKKGQWNMIKRPIWKGGTIIQKDIESSILNPLSEVNDIKYNPEGKIVKIKKKCTKFPYCNQGAIDNPLDISNTVKGDGSYVEEGKLTNVKNNQVQEITLSNETIKNIHEISKETGKSFTDVYRIVKEQMKLR